MKIAISSDSEKLDSKVSMMGGRALYYLIFENKELIEVYKNPFASGGGGAGYSVAHVMQEKGVDVLISGKIGINMDTALKEKNIEFKEMTGLNIKQALNQI